MLSPQSLLAFIALLGVLITVHELGHFLAAKWAGVQVLTFSIGFGPKMVGFTRGETEYQIAWIPIGGYVRMVGELPGDELEPGAARRSYQSAPWWKRAIISVAGPAMNLALPVLVLFFAFLGEHEVLAPRVGDVEPGFPAAAAGVQPGDVVVRIDDEPVTQWGDIPRLVSARQERPVRVTLLRDGAERTLTITPAQHVAHDAGGRSRRGMLGITAVPSPPIIGVAHGSAAHAAGLRTFDRVVTLDGAPVRDELALANRVSQLPEGTQVVIAYARAHLFEVGGATLVAPSLGQATVTRGPGRGYEALGVEPGELYVWGVEPKSPAARAGVARGDRLLTVGGVRLESAFGTASKLAELGTEPFVLAWRTAEGGLERSATLAQEVQVLRDSHRNRVDLPDLGARLRPAYLGGAEVLAAGPTAERIRVRLGPSEALRASLREVPQAIAMVATAIGALLTGQSSFNQVGSVGSLFIATADAVDRGLQAYLELAAVVSVNLGLVNLLPIPILDGFAILAALWEGIRRRAIPPRARELANTVGFAVLAGLFLFIVLRNELPKFFPDIFRW